MIKKNLLLKIYVSPTGNDANLGTKNNPYLSFEKALEEVKKYAGKEGVTVWFHAGEYYLKETIEIGSEYSASKKGILIKEIFLVFDFNFSEI